ncbi:MAG: hypothetical protein ACYC2G_06110 [Gemmatimonadaceae bacterium]
MDIRDGVEMDAWVAAVAPQFAAEVAPEAAPGGGRSAAVTAAPIPVPAARDPGRW